MKTVTDTLLSSAVRQYTRQHGTAATLALLTDVVRKTPALRAYAKRHGTARVIHLLIDVVSPARVQSQGAAS